jgi:DHA2 family multidrug resistance protein
MVARRMAEHRAVLVEKVTSYREPALERIHALTASFAHRAGDLFEGQRQAYRLIDRIVDGQAALLAYQDLFFYAAALFIVSLPIILLLRGHDHMSDAAREAAAEAH